MNVFATKQLENPKSIHTFNWIALKFYPKSLSVEGLKDLRVIEAKQQEEIRRIQKLEEKIVLEEMNKQKIIQSKLKQRFGRTRFLYDFFDDRIL